VGQTFRELQFVLDSRCRLFIHSGRSEPNANADADANTDTDADTYSDADTDTDADTDADTFAVADAKLNSFANRHLSSLGQRR
jgi:hypothetical protein